MVGLVEIHRLSERDLDWHPDLAVGQPLEAVVGARSGCAYSLGDGLGCVPHPVASLDFGAGSPLRGSWDSHGDQLYFSIVEQESDVSVLEVERP